MRAGLAERRAEKQPAVSEMHRQVQEMGSSPPSPAPKLIKKEGARGRSAHLVHPFLL